MSDDKNKPVDPTAVAAAQKAATDKAVEAALAAQKAEHQKELDAVKAAASKGAVAPPTAAVAAKKLVKVRAIKGIMTDKRFVPPGEVCEVPESRLKRLGDKVAVL